MLKANQIFSKEVLQTCEFQVVSCDAMRCNAKKKKCDDKKKKTRCESFFTK